MDGRKSYAVYECMNDAIGDRAKLSILRKRACEVTDEDIAATIVKSIIEPGNKFEAAKLLCHALRSVRAAKYVLSDIGEPKLQRRAAWELCRDMDMSERADVALITNNQSLKYQIVHDLPEKVSALETPAFSIPTRASFMESPSDIFARLPNLYAPGASVVPPRKESVAFLPTDVKKASTDGSLAVLRDVRAASRSEEKMAIPRAHAHEVVDVGVAETIVLDFEGIANKLTAADLLKHVLRPDTAAHPSTDMECLPSPTKATTDARAPEDADGNSTKPSGSDSLCVVRLNKAYDTALIDCGHECLCTSCANALLETKPPFCPICRACVKGVLKTYKV